MERILGYSYRSRSQFSCSDFTIFIPLATVSVFCINIIVISVSGEQQPSTSNFNLDMKNRKTGFVFTFSAISEALYVTPTVVYFRVMISGACIYQLSFMYKVTICCALDLKSVVEFGLQTIYQYI